MPHKNLEARKDYNRERMQLRRERAKKADGATKAEGGTSAARVSSPPTLVKSGVESPSGQPSTAQPAPTIPATTPAASPDDNRKRLAQRYAEFKEARYGKPQYTHRTNDEIQAQRETSGSTSFSLATETRSVQAKPPADISLEQALTLLKTQGWGLWLCNSLSDDVVCILRDRNVGGFPPGYPLGELKRRPDGFLELFLLPGEVLKPQLRLIK